MHKKAEAQLNGAAAKCEITCALFKEGGKNYNATLQPPVSTRTLYFIYVWIARPDAADTIPICSDPDGKQANPLMELKFDVLWRALSAQFLWGSSLKRHDVECQACCWCHRAQREQRHRIWYWISQGIHISAFLLYQGILTGKILQHEILYFQCIKTVHDAATSNQVPYAPSNNAASIQK